MSEVKFDRERFAELIEEHYGSQTAFAEAADVSRQYINNLIRGDGSAPVPSLERLIQFAGLLQLDGYGDLLIIPKISAQTSEIAGVGS